VLGLAVSITLAETALALLALWWIVRVLRGTARPGWPLVWPIAIFTGVTIVAALASGRAVESLISSRGVLLLATMWIVRDAVPDAFTGRRLLRALLGFLGIASLVGIAQVTYCAEWPGWAARFGEAVPWAGGIVPWLARFGAKCHRARAFYSIYMTFGGVLTIVLLATLPELVWTRGRPRWAPLAWAVSCVAFALTYVRGAWLGFAAGIAVLGASLRRGRTVLFGGLVVLAVLLLLLPGVRARVRSIADPADPTTSERFLMWRSGVHIARDNLLVGIGAGQVKHVYPQYAAPEVTNKHRGHLHNAPLQVLVERGVVGLGAWLAIFAGFFVRAARIRRRIPEDSQESALLTGGVAATAGFLVGGLFEHNYGDSEVLLVATFVMGLVLAIEYSRSDSDFTA
jgi:O-antigen ligase